MGVTAWSRNPDENGRADPSIPAGDGAAARDYQRSLRGVMSGVKRHVDDLGGAIVSGGIDDAYTLQSFGGTSEYGRGSTLSFIADRANTGPVSLVVDGYASVSLRDRNGLPLLPNALRPGRLARIFYDPSGPFWRLEGLEVVKNDDFDPAPPNTIKGNDGQGLTDLAVDAARTLLQIDHVANKSEEELVAAGAVADALAAKATPADISAATSPILQSLNGKATTVYVDAGDKANADEIDLIEADIVNVKAQVSAIAAGQSSGVIVANTWAALNAVPPGVAGARAEVIGTATTTHTDPVTSTANTPDPGTYRGSLSPLGWQRIGPTTASAAAAQIGSGSPIVTTLLDNATLLTFAADGTTSQRFTGASLKALIEEVAVPRLYPQDIRGFVATNASKPALTADEFRRGDVSIQVIGSGDIGLRWGGGGAAAFGETGTWIQKAGQWVNHPNPGTGALSIIGRKAEGDASAVSLGVNIRVQRTVDAPPTAIGPADTIFSLWKDSADPRYTAVIRQEVQYLIDNNIYGLLKGWWMPGASKENFRVNLANPNGPLLAFNEGTGTTPIAFRPYIGVKGNGTDQHISTGILPADAAMTASDHMLYGRAVSATDFDAGQMMGNDGTLFIQPNRGAQLYGTRSGTGTDTNVAVPKPLGKWGGFSRDNDAANYSTYIDGDFVETKARTLPSMIPRQFNILAGSGVTGVASRSTIESGGVVISRGLAAISMTRLTNSLKRIDAVCAQIVGA